MIASSVERERILNGDFSDPFAVGRKVSRPSIWRSSCDRRHTAWREQYFSRRSPGSPLVRLGSSSQNGAFVVAPLGRSISPFVLVLVLVFLVPLCAPRDRPKRPRSAGARAPKSCCGPLSRKTAPVAIISYASRIFRLMPARDCGAKSLGAPTEVVGKPVGRVSGGGRAMGAELGFESSSCCMVSCRYCE